MRTIIFNSVRDIYYRQSQITSRNPTSDITAMGGSAGIGLPLEHKIESDMHKSARQARKPQPTKPNLIRRQNKPLMLKEAENRYRLRQESNELKLPEVFIVSALLVSLFLGFSNSLPFADTGR